MQKRLLFISLSLLFAFQSGAQDRLLNQQVPIKRCNVSISANAFVATTIIELEFYNPGNIEVEAQHFFHLNRGQVITGFQLDLNGKYRDGSIEERGKANRAYSSIVGKRIDPAILQMNGQDSYSLHIYPVASRQSRKVRITILQMMKEEKERITYALPLQFPGSTDLFTLTANVSNTEAQPLCNKGILEGRLFAKAPAGAVLSLHEKNIILNNNISFSLLLQKNKPLICISKENGVSKFFLRFSPSVERYYPARPKSITVFWDVSRSAGSRKIKTELKFLEKYISTNQILTTKFILFNQQLISTFGYDLRKDDFSTIKHYLANYSYDGATQLGNLDFSIPGSDAILLFSDGINSFGKSIPDKGTVPVTCIVSATGYATQQLQNIVSFSGGQIIQVNENNIDKAINKTDSAENYLLSYRSPGNSIKLNEKFPIRLGQSTILSGTFTEPDNLHLMFGNNHSVNYTEQFYLSPAGTACDTALEDQISLLKAYDSMMYTGYDWYQRLYFGLEHKVVTTQTSYLVLERTEDYIRYNIAPPKELKQQCAEMNYVYQNEYKLKALKLNAEREGLVDVVANYNQKIVWWDKAEPLIDLSKPANSSVQEQNSESATSSYMAMNDKLDDGSFKKSELQSVVVTSMGQVRQHKSIGYSTAIVRSAEITRGRQNIQQALMGKVSGLSVTGAGNAYGDRNITLRGTRSLSGNTSPLLVLDGLPVGLSALSTINPNDIKDITVLKPGWATAVYGSTAVNGAILINIKGRRGNYNYPVWKEYKLSEIEDIEYLQEIREGGDDNAWKTFKELEKIYSNEPGFYFDMANHFFEKGAEKKAMDILYNAAELCNGSVQGMKAVAYMLEGWKKFDDAITIYKNIAEVYENDLTIKRDLALAYYQKGEYQLAVNMYYQIISFEEKQSPQFYYQDPVIRLTAMNEMNAVIAAHQDKLDLKNINRSLIRPLPVDLRISIESNRNVTNFQVEEPDGSVCNHKNNNTKNGGYNSHIMNTDYYYYADQPCNEYQIRNAIKGKYKIKVDAYNMYAYPQSVPNFIRVITFKNFHSKEQSLEVKNIIIDNQYGTVEIHETAW